MIDANPFEILGISPDAEPDDYWAAYEALVLKWRADSVSVATAAESDRRISELNWAIDELEARHDEWARRVRRQPQPAARRGVPLLGGVFVVLLVAGIGLLAWTFTSSDNDGSTNKVPAASSQPLTEPPASSQGAPGQTSAATPLAPSSQGPSSQTSAATPVARSLEPINIAQVYEDIRKRRAPPGAGPLQFAEPEFANLTGASQPDVVVEWSSGGTCGNFVEVWGYLEGKATNLSPKDDRNGDGFGCGGSEIRDYLNNGRQQLATTARTYDPKQFDGGEYLVRTVWCWTGSEFKAVVSYYENSDLQRLRTETHNPPQICK